MDPRAVRSLNVSRTLETCAIENSLPIDKQLTQDAINSLETVGVISGNPDVPIKSMLDNISRAIGNYRALDFDYRGERDGKTVLIKVNTKDSQLDPIHPYEAKIQALRYLRGMLLILDNSEAVTNSPYQGSNESINKIPEQLRKDILKIYNKYHHNTNEPNKQLDQLNFVDELAGLIQRHYGLMDGDKARKELSMAKNVGELLEDHPIIATCSQSQKKPEMVTVEIAANAKISKEFYQEEMTDLPNRPWFQHAKFAVPGWAANIFNNQQAEITRLGVPAPSSARWMPQPCNLQKVETIVLENNKIKSHSRWCRIGTVGLSEILDKNNKEKLADRQFQEALNATLNTGVDQFQALYADLYNPTQSEMFFCYQSLLTPIAGEHRLWHKDNNSKFVTMTGDIFKRDSLTHEKKVKINFAHTNSGINKLADTIIASVDIHDSLRQNKIKATEDMLKSYYHYRKGSGSDALPEDLANLDYKSGLKSFNELTRTNKNDPHLFATTIAENGTSNVSPELKEEIYKRAYAYICLQMLLAKEGPYKSLPNYQRNLMMAGIEYHLMGSQAITLAGCKSARDRTAIFGGAVKTMQENPNAMLNWQVLNDGIINSLNQGHHFRALSHHCAIAKVGAVHHHYISQLAQSAQNKIKLWGKFTKKHEPIDQEKNAALVDALAKDRVVTVSQRLNISSPAQAGLFSATPARARSQPVSPNDRPRPIIIGRKS